MADDKTTGVPATLPVDDILLSVAEGVVKAQAALDEAALATEIELQESGVAEQYGISARWYTIPEVALELKLAFEIDESGEVKSQLVDADYQQRYGFSVTASSELKTKIVATPPAEGSGISLLEESDVLARVGRIKRIVEAWDQSEAPTWSITFRPWVTAGYSGGFWYVAVVDATLGGPRVVRALDVLDDASGEVAHAVWT